MRAFFLCGGLTATLLLSTSGVASAAQSKPVTDFNGTYGLTCGEASLVLTMSITGMIGNAAGSWYGSAEAPLDCDGVDDGELDAFVDDMTGDCTAGGLPEPDCRALAEDIGQAVADLNNDLIDVLPRTVKMTVTQTSNWFYKLWGVYPTIGDHTDVYGTTSTWTYLLNNNDGYVNGDFWAGGLAFGDSGTSGNLSCGIVAAAAVDGHITRGTPFAIEADFVVDESMVCSVVEGDDWLIGTIGLAYVGSLDGAKL